MSNIDERIVKMEFDNKLFEKNIKASTNSLNTFKQSLNFKGAEKGLNTLSNEVNKFDMSHLSESVNTVKERFSALQVIGITALAKITSGAIDAGKALVKSLTFDQISAGMTKYEQKTASVQTIMNATGKSIDEVNAYLDKLMWYSDETSYGFTDMTAALAQMTASGGKIDKIIPLIEGVANATAYAGKGASEFSRAMYNLNQSYSSGYLNYMDWKSLELAGVASKELKQILIDTGVQMGKIKKGQVTIANFGTTLQSKWASTAVMEKAFGKFSSLTDAAYEAVKAGKYDTASEAIQALSGNFDELASKSFRSAQEAKSFTEAIDATKDAVSSGWMKTTEIIFGNYEEAKVIWTDLANTLWDLFAASGDVRNEMLQAWKDLGGRQALLDSIKNTFEGISSILAPIKEGFREIFPEMTAERLYAMTENLKNFTEKIKIGEETADQLKRTFKGLFAALDIGVQVIKAISSGIGKLLGIAKPAGEGVLKLTSSLGDYLVKLDEMMKTSGILNTIVTKVTDATQLIVTNVTNFVKRVSEAIKSFIHIDTSAIDEFVSNIKDKFHPIEALGILISSVANTIVKIAKKTLPFFYKLGQGFATLFNSLAKTVGNIIQNFDINQLLTLINTGLIGGILVKLKQFIDSIKGVTENGGKILDSVKDILDGVKDSLEAYQNTLKAKTLKEIAIAIGILAAGLFVIASIDKDKLVGSLTAISVLFADLMLSLKGFAKIIDASEMKGITKIAAAMIALSLAVDILAVAMKKVSDLDWDGIIKGLTTIALLSFTLVKVAKSLSKSSGQLMKGTVGLIAFAGSIVILTKAVEKIGKLDIKEWAKGLGGIGILLAELAVFLKITDFSKSSSTKMVALIGLAASINILAKAVEKIGKLDIKEWAKGLGGIGILLAELAVFINTTKTAKGTISTATGMVILASSMLILAKAIEKIGSIDIDTLRTGLIAMSLALLAVTVSLMAMPDKMISKSVGMIGMAAALLIVGKAIKNIGSLDMTTLTKGLGSISIALGVLALALLAMNNSLAGSAALLVAATALTVLAIPLKIFSKMKLEEIGASLLMLGGALAIFGIAGAVLGPMAPMLLAVSGALAIFGVAIAAIGVGVLALSAGLSALAVSGTVGAASLVSVLTMIIGLLPMVFQQIGQGFITILTTLADSGVAIVTSVSKILLALITAVGNVAEPLITTVVDILMLLLSTLADKTPDIVQAGFDMLIGFLQGIADNISMVVQTAIDIVLNFLDGIEQKLPDVIDAGFDLIISFIDGLADSVEKNTPRLMVSVTNLGKSIVKGVLNGIKESAKSAVDGIKELGQNIIDGFKKVLHIESPSKEFKELGGYTVQGLINGIKEKFTDVTNIAKTLGSNIVNSVKKFLQIESPSKVMKNEVGKYIVQGISEGIKADTSAEDAATKKAQNIVNAFKTELNKADLKASTANLEYQLWAELNRDSITQADKDTKQIELLQRKIATQAEAVQLAQGEYEVTLKQFGAEDYNTKSAYSKLLQDQLDLAKLVNELNDYQKTMTDNQDTAKKEYIDYINKNSEWLQSFGYTIEQIKAEASKVSGYDPQNGTSQMKSDISNSVKESMETVKDVYNQSATATFGQLTEDYSEWGTKYAEAMTDALKAKSPDLQTAAKEILDECITLMKSYYNKFVDAGKGLASGFVKGLETAKQAISNTISYQIEKTTNQITTDPMYQAGEYTTNQFVDGMTNSSSSKKAKSSFNDVISSIAKGISKIASTNPVIRPVVDLANVTASSEKIKKLLSGSSTISPTASTSSARKASSSIKSNKESSSSSSDKPLLQKLVSFTQNISSPKPVNTSEVYRQTKSLFSSVKGAVEES